MAKILFMLLLLTLLSQACCLQCNTCHGEYNCVGENVACDDPSASCTTSVRKASVSFLEFQSVRKGCARQLYPFESISLTSHLMSLSYQAHYCVEDGCNNETYFVSHPAPANHMRCHTCASQGAWCPEASRTQISCIGHQDQCVDLDITGKLGHYSNLKLKGCTSLPRCEDTLSFYSGGRTIHASCCNTPLCNSFTPDLHMQSQAANGLECYSCVDEEGAGAGCANQTISKVQCTGIHSMCLEGIGNSRKAGKDVSLVTFKGCASPAMCQSSLLALVQELDNTDIICCQGNLCNDRIVDGVITQPRVPADSPEYFEEVGCAALSPTPSGPRPNLDCFYSNEVEDGNMVAHSPTGEVPSPKNHTDEETVYIADEKEASENFVNESNARPSSHHDHTIAGGNPYEENLLGDSSESNGTTPTGVSNSEHGSSGSSSAIMNLDTSNSSARPTSSGHHSGVAVLIPFIIPKRNTTTTATTSSALETSVSKEVLAASGNENDVESEECEAEEEDIATGKHFVAASANDHEDSPSTHLASSFHESGTPQNTSSSAEDTPNASVFVREGNSDESESYSSSTENTHNVSVLTAEEHGSPHFPVTDTSGSTSREGDHGATGGESAVVDNSIPVSAPTSNGATSDGIASYILPIPPITSQDNSFFLTEGTGKADASAAANTNVTNSINSPGMGLVAGAGTSRPKTKIPCKRPGSQNPPGVNRVSSSGTGSPGTEEDTVRNASTSFYSNAKSPERNAAGKVNPASGAVGLTSNVGLFSLTLLLAALTCLVC